MHEKEQLLLDIIEIDKIASKNGYTFTKEDAFVIGYLVGKYQGVERILNNEDTMHFVCEEYDKTDDLGLMDSISEILKALRIIAIR